MLDVLELLSIHISLPLLTLHLVLLLLEYLIKALEADGVLQLNVTLICEVLDPKRKHRRATEIGRSDVISLSKKDGILFKYASLDIMLALLDHLLGQDVVGLLQVLLREELLDLQGLEALLTIRHI